MVHSSFRVTKKKAKGNDDARIQRFGVGEGERRIADSAGEVGGRLVIFQELFDVKKFLEDGNLRQEL